MTQCRRIVLATGYRLEQGGGRYGRAVRLRQHHQLRRLVRHCRVSTATVLHDLCKSMLRDCHVRSALLAEPTARLRTKLMSTWQQPQALQISYARTVRTAPIVQLRAGTVSG